MPKFPGLSGADIVRALEKLGFVMVRQTGSHIIMRNGIVGCVVPNHKEVKVGPSMVYSDKLELAQKSFQKRCAIRFA
jgi:predicted RNA binding protein YcfA (HicA-like mRNA interferase family)